MTELFQACGLFCQATAPQTYLVEHPLTKARAVVEELNSESVRIRFQRSGLVRTFARQRAAQAVAQYINLCREVGQ